jgi:hypothetical protein
MITIVHSVITSAMTRRGTAIMATTGRIATPESGLSTAVRRTSKTTEI